jgi:hypothetical protein
MPDKKLWSHAAHLTSNCRAFATAILIVAPFLISVPSIAQFAPALKFEEEETRLQQDLEAAKRALAGYEGGLIKNIVGARIEVLQLSLALIQQRKIGATTGARTVDIPSSKPDLDRAASIEREIRVIDGRIAAAQTESAKTGGLIKGLIDSRVATDQLSLAMLQAELLKAKYGIAWIPSRKTADTTQDEGANLKPTKNDGSKELPKGAQFLIPTITNKRFRASDWQKGIHEDNLLFDVVLATASLPAPTRSVKGAIVFADLFGEVKARVGWTINAKLTPGKEHREEGIGIKYNQFNETHAWLKSTNVNDMRVWFELKDVIYQDGKRESFDQ